MNSMVKKQQHSQDIRVQRSIQKKLTRQLQIKNELLVLLLSAFIIMFVIFFYNGFLVQANASQESVYKYYKSIEVHNGDTLWSIAQCNMDDHYDSVSEYVKEIKTMNSISGSKIISGQHLIVPYYSHEVK